MTRNLAIGGVLFLCCAGCEPRSGMNASCIWPPELTSSLDLSRKTDRLHLADDVRVAEELGIRHADGKGKLQPDWDEVRSGCEDRLFAGIAHAHGVLPTQVREARRGLDEATFDWVATLPMMVIYIISSWTMAGWVARRFSPDGGWAVGVGAGLVSVVVAIAVMMVGNLLGAVVLMLRMASMHASYRALRPSWMGEHRHGLLVAGIVVFWIVAVVRYRAGLNRPCS